MTLPSRRTPLPSPPSPACSFVPNNEGPGGECTSLSCSSCGRLVAMGCRGGGVIVHSLRSSDQAEVVASHRPPVVELPKATRSRRSRGTAVTPEEVAPSADDPMLPPLVRKLALVASSSENDQTRGSGALPNAVRDIQWSSDGSELLTVDQVGITRV